ncbi:MAG: carboxypeptidase regulatory-like domain-containing protein [Coriobacteriia bacterium]|nr:carboxypeptidase regulatory-like domain-containing protein [Coriobacteriia bacterium]
MSHARATTRKALQASLAAVLLVASLVIAPAPAAAAANPRAVSPFGMAAHVLGDYPEAEVDRQIALVSAGGASWIRVDIPWRFFEPKDGVYDPHPQRQLDYICKRAQAHGLRVLVLVIETPNWANGGRGPWVPPNDDTKFEEFMRFISARYAGRIDHWELGNEVNERGFWDVPRSQSAARYVRFLQHGYRGVKAGNPSAKVVSAGLAGSDDPYLIEMYNAGAKGYFDILGVHAYTNGRSPYAKPDLYRPGSSFDWLRVMKTTLERHGDGDKKIWITETGWQTSVTDGNVTPERQAQYTYDAYKRIYQDFPFVETLFVYTVRDGSFDRTVRTDNYGLLRRDYSPKPAYSAFKRAQIEFQRRPSALTARSSDYSAKARSSVVAKGVLSSSGRPVPGATVRLQRYVGGKWVFVRSAKTDARGTYAVRAYLASRGTYRYRVSYAGTKARRSAISRSFTVRAW